jgi:hypothetical protein
MASGSLNKMTVPLASDQSSSTQGLLMPKLKYRFRVSFQNFGTGKEPSVVEMTKQVMSFTRPNLSFEEIPIPIYNSTVKLAGKYTWNDVTCEVRDDASGNVGKLIGQQLQKQMDFFEMASAGSGIDYKFTTVVQILDGGNGGTGPTVLETWELYGCYLKSADYGALNYGESAPATVNLTIAYDNAAQAENLDNANLANAVGAQIANLTRTPTGAATGAGTTAGAA